MRRYPRLYGFGIFCLLLGTFVLAFSVRAQGTSSITGKVTGDGGAPVANVLVVVYRPNNITGFIFWEETAQGTTNATGDYQISDLESDTYRVGFLPQSEQRDYFDQYYSGATDVYSATDVIVPAATVVPNINVQLDSGAHIKGKVTGPANENLGGIHVEVFNQSFFKSVDTKANGTYDVGGLTAGTYTVKFSDISERPQYAAELFNNKRLNEAPTTITLTDGQIRNNVNAQLDRLAVIKGRVTNLTNLPLAEISVTGEKFSDEPPFTSISDEIYTDTDANGVYTMTSLYAGTWRVRFTDNRYRSYNTEWFNDTYDANAATLLTITFNSTTSNINAQLSTRGAITGTVTNGQAQPIAEIEVVAEEYYQLDTGSYNWRQVSSDYSDVAGKYTLCCMNPGSYRIRFSDARQRYITEYYDQVFFPDAFGPETVTMVQVTPTMTTTNINAQLSMYSQMIGTVTDELGNPAGQIAVNMFRYDLTGGGSWNQINTAYTNENGAYRGQVLPGRYRIYFSDLRAFPNYYINEYYENAPTLDVATDITITGSSTITIDAALAAKARITGRVTDSSGNPAANIRVSLYEQTEFNGWLSNFPIETDSNGNYMIGGLKSGVYRIGFSDERAQRRYVNEFYNDRATTVQEADDITVPTDDALVSGIDAQLAKLSTLQGQVTNEDGEPLPFISITPQRYIDLGIDGRYWQSAEYGETDENGEYTITGLFPGLYRLHIQDYNSVYQGEWYDNQGYEATATTFQLAAETVLTGVNAQLTNEPFSWPPLAQNDETIVSEGEMINHPNILNNDFNDSEGRLQAITVALPAHGTLTLNTDGIFTYLHDGSEASSDYFTYRVNDGIKQSNLATVTITILPINDLPMANDDATLVVRGGTVTALTGGATSLLANDNDPDDAALTAAVLANPQHGTLTLNSNGSFSYHHNGDSATSDSFTYRALDSFGAADSATVTITIVDEAPLTFSKTVSIEGIKPRCTNVDEMKVPVGTTIVYCYSVRNNGTQAVTSHSLVDSHLGQLLTNVAFNLAPGATYSTTFTQTLSVTTTNVATWTASAAPAENTLLAPLAVTVQKAATVRISGPTDDADNDTIPDNLERAGDIDGDNLPNFLDTDADGDGVGDQAEVGASPLQPQDSDNDGIPDYLDAVIQTGGTERLYLPLIYR